VCPTPAMVFVSTSTAPRGAKNLLVGITVGRVAAALDLVGQVCFMAERPLPPVLPKIDLIGGCWSSRRSHRLAVGPQQLQVHNTHQSTTGTIGTELHRTLHQTITNARHKRRILQSAPQCTLPPV